MTRPATRSVFPICLTGALLAQGAAALETSTIYLWPEGAPGALGDKEKDKPKIVLHQPDQANKTAVVICPGGGYGGLAMGHEGKDIAAWLNKLGVTAVVLDYRHRGKGYGHPAPMQDVQRALRTVRAIAEQWKIAADRIGIIGFSAGGHLASTAVTHFDQGNPESSDPVERVSCRPDFAMLCYPVIALDEPHTHRGSQKNLLGEDPPKELVRSLSNEKQVTNKTPPTFLFHTTEDKAVKPENSVEFYLALRRAGVPAELHVFERGRHGVGLATAQDATRAWPQLCENWLRLRDLLPKKP